MSRKNSLKREPSWSPRESLITDTEISELSLKQWHKQMQDEHEVLQASGFKSWSWCNKGCYLCQKFDNIDYEKKISKCCLTFKTFKTLGTIALMTGFFYIFMYSLLGGEFLPGGTIFFVFGLFVLAYGLGYLVVLIGLPSLLGHLATGVVLKNVPSEYLPARDDHLIEKIANISEQIFLTVALMRAGLLLDMTRLRHKVRFILRLATLPVVSELTSILLLGHYTLGLPWEWSALQGACLSLISLGSTISIMEKNKIHGYGEDKHLSTVLIAAAAINVIVCLLAYFICLSYVLPEKAFSSVWAVVAEVTEEITLGILVGVVAGMLLAFFPDKRNQEAATLRILIIGLACFGIVNIFRKMKMAAAGALGCLITCVVAGNMWEELGWHKKNNPVLYFYGVAYYFGQPFVLSLVGFTIDLGETSAEHSGYIILIIIVGLISRAMLCYFSTILKGYPTTIKEKIFICIAWSSKGTFQVLLSFAVKYMIPPEEDITKALENKYYTYSRFLRQSTVIGILLTTPIVCYSLTWLSPKLLQKIETGPPPVEQAKKSETKLAEQARKSEAKLAGPKPQQNTKPGEARKPVSKT